MLWSVDNSQTNVFADLYHMTISQAQAFLHFFLPSLFACQLAPF